MMTPPPSPTLAHHRDYSLMLQPTVIQWFAHVSNCIDLDQAPLLGLGGGIA